MQKTFETPGPTQPNGMALDKRAQQIFAYFKKYNYEVEGAGDVIRFVGNYKASRGQAAALTFYVFMGESTNLDPKSGTDIAMCQFLYSSL